MSGYSSYRSYNNTKGLSRDLDFEDQLNQRAQVPEKIPSVMDFSRFRDSGELSDIAVEVGDKEFLLHKFPLYIKSDFFRALAKGDDRGDRISLDDFPGGPETFETVANYCYNMRTNITKENVCPLRCAAEYLQMTSGGNLASTTDRFLQDTLTTAKLGRSLSVILDLVIQCRSLGPIAEQAKIVEKCTNAIVDCWLISSKFGRRLQTMDVVGGDKATFKKLCEFPLNWFMQLFVTARDKSVRPAVLAAMVEMYISGAMERETRASQKVAEPATPPHANEEEESQDQNDTTKVDENGVIQTETNTEQSNESHNVQEDVKGKDKMSVADDESEDENSGPQEDLGAILDALLAELPDNAPLADTISPQWAAKMLQTADSLGCKSRERLLKLAGRVLHRFTEEEFKCTSPELLCEVVKETKEESQNGGHAKNVGEVVDNYALYQSKQDQLTVEMFQKLVEVIPAEHRVKHDTLFMALENLLGSDKVEVTEDEKQAMLEMIDFTRLSEETLQRAYESKLVPVNYITKASLQLCAKLRTELDAARSIIQSQELELEKYGLGGRGSSWLTKYDAVPFETSRYESMKDGGTSQSISSDSEFRQALDSVDRSLDRSLAMDPATKPTIVETTTTINRDRNYFSSTYSNRPDPYVNDVDYNSGNIYRKSCESSEDLYGNPYSTALYPRSYTTRDYRY